MATRGRWTWWLRLTLVVAATSTWWQLANSKPETNLLNRACSQYNATNITLFFSHLNATLADLRTQLSESRLFATAKQVRPSQPVYTMIQCRTYMSEADCLACYHATVSDIRTCYPASGARVTYDGCFLRYESSNFFVFSTFRENVAICGNRTASRPAAFDAAGRRLLRGLEVATPRTNGYFAAATGRVPDDNNLMIYGIAQCAEKISQSDCQHCLTAAYGNVQDCLPYAADGRAIDTICFLRYSDTPFFANNQTINITPFLGGGGNSMKKKAIIGGVVGGGGLSLILVALFLRYKFSRRPTTAPVGNILGATELQRPNIYSYKDLKAATNNFSEENKLGEGSFGVVYKVAAQQATMKNGNVIAVKKLDISCSRAKANFETEVSLISNVHHRNLVRLLGCCSKGSELLLIYEYIANGSLDKFLYGDKRGSLTWKQRFDIIFGAARGLAYLHELYHVTVIHRDIKPSNILLDDEFQAKIADFGLARLLPGNQSHVSTRFAGTLGYTAPEYAIHGHLSEKVDTYSFGVVVLETISGRRCSDMNEDSDTGYLLEEAWKTYESGLHQRLADEALNADEYKPEDLKKMVEIGLLCTQSPPSSRPTMSEIVAMLLCHRSVEQKAPSRPSWSYGNRVVVETASISMGSSASNATSSISHFTGRWPLHFCLEI